MGQEEKERESLCAFHAELSTAIGSNYVSLSAAGRGSLVDYEVKV